MVWKGKTPEVSIADAQTMGFKIMIFPGLLFKATMGPATRRWPRYANRAGIRPRMRR
jgi:hypothetical protein